MDNTAGNTNVSAPVYPKQNWLRTEIQLTITFSIYFVKLLEKLSMSASIKSEINWWRLQHCPYCNLIPLPASWWLKMCSTTKAAPSKEQSGIMVSDVLMATVPGTSPLFMNISVQLLFHTLCYCTATEGRMGLHQKSYKALNPTGSSLHFWACYSAFLLCVKQQRAK